MKKNVVIIGAGYGGILTAKKLAKSLKRDEVQITLIDKKPYHTMLTELHEVAAGRVEEDSIKISLSKVFARRRVNLVQDTANSIDFEDKKVQGNLSDYPYDILVLAAGSKPTFFGVDGAPEYAKTLWSFEDAVKLREHINEMFRLAAVETDTEKKRSYLTFYVVGAGLTGVEMAGELAEYVPALCARHDIDRKLVRVINVDQLSRVVPALPEKIARKVERRYGKMGIELMLNTGVCSIGPDFIDLTIGSACQREKTHTVIWTAGIESADITAKAGQNLKNTNRGRIVLDSYLRSEDDKSVYVVGDNMYYVSEETGQCVPQMVENCEQASSVAASNIVHDLTGRGRLNTYKPSFHGVMVSIGSRYAAAYVGTEKRKISLASFFAMFVKHFINIIYFLQVAGWNKVFSYLKHEFFTIRGCRSFVGGHFSNRTPSFLLVPLRVFLGMVWLYEGIMKIVGGWFKEPGLEGFIEGAKNFFNGIINSGASAAADLAAAATGTGDAVGSATGASGGEAVGTVLLNHNILGLFDVIFVSAKELAKSTIDDFAIRINVPLMNWFLETFIYPYPGMQIFMQIFMVTAEILIGLALMGGLFTAPASALSIVLQLMFVCTTGLYLGKLWMIFAGIAVLIGAGRTLGLDYYAMPWLKSLWRRIPFIRKWYLYHD